MSHVRITLTLMAHLGLVRLVVDDEWAIARAAEYLYVAWPTAKRWGTRYEQMAPRGWATGPGASPQPTRTPVHKVKTVVHLRGKQRLSPMAIAARTGIPASTVHAVLVRCRLHRLSHVDVRTGEPVRRYEHPHPGLLIHVDVTKLGNTPDGGGWRFVGRAHGGTNRSTMIGATRSIRRAPLVGTAFVRTVIDDHSRVAYAEIHADEKAATAIGVLARAVSWFAARGIRVERVLRQQLRVQVPCLT